MRRERVPKEVWVVIGVRPGYQRYAGGSTSKRALISYWGECDGVKIVRYVLPDPSPSTVEKKLRDAIEKWRIAASKDNGGGAAENVLSCLSKRGAWESIAWTTGFSKEGIQNFKSALKLLTILRATRKDAR